MTKAAKDVSKQVARLDWRNGMRAGKKDCVCPCGTSYHSHIMYARGLGWVSHDPCPNCGRQQPDVRPRDERTRG
jgi:hypothetical protein